MQATPKSPLRRRMLLSSILASYASRSMASDINYPTRAIRIVVPSGAGGFADITARAVALEMGETLRQHVYIENKPGAGGIVGTLAGARAQPDGYTLLRGALGTLVVLPIIESNIGYDVARDFKPVGMVSSPAFGLVVRAAMPVNDFASFIAYVRAKPGELNYGSAGKTSLPHLSMELLKHHANLDLKHIPYRSGSESVTAVVSGEIDATFDALAVVAPFVHTGQLKLLALASPQRSPLAPHVPTTNELGYPDVVTGGWSALLVPSATPVGILDTLSRALQKLLATPDFRKKLELSGDHVYAGTAQEYETLFAAEKARWTSILHMKNILAE